MLGSIKHHIHLRVASFGSLIAFLLLTGIFTAAPAFAQQSQVQPQQQQATFNTPSTGSIADNVCLGVLAAQASTKPAPTSATVSSCDEDGTENFGVVIRRIINIFSVVVGAVSVIMVIIGGFRYVVSGGDSSNISKAKNTILYALVGMVIVLFAQVIIRFILTAALK